MNQLNLIKELIGREIVFSMIIVLSSIIGIFSVLSISTILFFKRSKIPFCVSILLIILGFLSGYVWGSLTSCLCYSFAFPTGVIGAIIGGMNLLPKRVLTKILFVVFILLFIFTPQIESRVYHKVISHNLEKEIK